MCAPWLFPPTGGPCQRVRSTSIHPCAHLAYAYDLPVGLSFPADVPERCGLVHGDATSSYRFPDLLFCQDNREHIREQNPDIKPHDMARKFGELWKLAGEDVRQVCARWCACAVLARRVRCAGKVRRASFRPSLFLLCPSVHR